MTTPPRQSSSLTTTISRHQELSELKVAAEFAKACCVERVSRMRTRDWTLVGMRNCTTLKKTSIASGTTPIRARPASRSSNPHKTSFSLQQVYRTASSNLLPRSRGRQLLIRRPFSSWWVRCCGWRWKCWSGHCFAQKAFLVAFDRREGLPSTPL